MHDFWRGELDGWMYASIRGKTFCAEEFQNGEQKLWMPRGSAQICASEADKQYSGARLQGPQQKFFCVAEKGNFSLVWMTQSVKARIGLQQGYKGSPLVRSIFLGQIADLTSGLHCTTYSREINCFLLTGQKILAHEHWPYNGVEPQNKYANTVL